MKKKNLFNVKYVRVYLMLNALKMKSFDYKSIALPTELQGHEVFFNSIYYIIKKLFLLIYMMKNYCCTIGYIQTLNVFVNIYLY